MILSIRRIGAALLPAVMVCEPALAQLGAVITPPAAVNTNAANDNALDEFPELGADGAGRWVAVWTTHSNLNNMIGTEGDIAIARSSDSGQTWSPIAPLASNAATDTGEDERPAIAANGMGVWIVAWDSNEDLNGQTDTENDILYAVSNDHGVTWTPPAPLNNDAAGDDFADFGPHVFTDRNGTWIAVWSRTGTAGSAIGDDTDIAFARSTDNGATWTAPQLLNSGAESDEGLDSISSLATDGEGAWMATWETTNDLTGGADTDRDIAVAHSSDHGETWSDPVAVNAFAGDDAEFDGNPDVATDRQGRWVVIWGSTRDLDGGVLTNVQPLAAHSVDLGATWSAPHYLVPDITMVDGGNLDFNLAFHGSHHWVAVWASEDTLGGTIGGDRDVLVARSIDGGETWSDPVPMNTNAGSDTGSDDMVEFVTDGLGNWGALWRSTDSLNNTIEPDADILFARFALPDCNLNGVGDGEDVTDGTSSDDDGDLVPNDCDECPDDGEKGDPGVCGCGTPDVDSDGDDVPDCFDDCPEDAAKLQPGVCGCGAADDDTDGDLILDCQDNCPNTANGDQANGDGDDHGDTCDNCPGDANNDQADADTDGTGDVCEPPECGVGCGAGLLPTLPVLLLAHWRGRRRRTLGARRRC